MSTTTAPKGGILARAIRASEAKVVPKFLLAGEHGAGKTHCMATAPGLFAVCFEGNQSKSTIRSRNPSAMVFEVNNAADFRELGKAILNGELDGFQMIGIDSLNEMQAYFDKEYEDIAKSVNAKTANGKENKWAKFREMKSKMGNAFVFLRDMPLPVAATIRTKSETDDDTGVTRVRFNLDGDAKNTVGAYFTATAYIYKGETGVVGVTRRYAMFSGPENFPCREMENLRGICVPDIQLWLKALEASDPPEGLYVPDARMPGERVGRAKIDTSY